MNRNTMPTTYNNLVDAISATRNGVAKLANNTTAERWCSALVGQSAVAMWMEDAVLIRLHGHGIVVIKDDGRVFVRHCGYPTVTTFDRIKRFLPRGWTCSRSGGDPRVESDEHEQYAVRADVWTPSMLATH